MAGFSNTTENDVLNHIFAGTSISYAGGSFFISLHTGDPGETGTANECTLSGYARKAHSSWSTSSAGTLSNSSDITFTAIGSSESSTATITHVGIFTASSGGTFIGGGAVGASKTIGANDIPKILSGELDITLD